jgi:ubiquinone/menaquinone biosynthesis C-methylase UbiE
MTLQFASHEQAVCALQQQARQLLSGRHGIRALEAGAGKLTRLDLPADAYIVGVDTDAAALARNERLNEQVLSDLASYSPPDASFDVVTCWYVLEHVSDPAALLDAFARWATPGGLIVLAVPSLRSLKALVTKLTPHKFHVWFRRRVLGFSNAGKPGYGPYPTTLRWPIRPKGLRRWASHAGLEVVFEGYFEDDKQVSVRRRLRLTGQVWIILCALTRTVSLGLLDAARTELLLMVRRPIMSETPARPSYS